MLEKKHRGERLLEIDNLHSAGCGPPPSLDAADKYLGYFENCYGEQWVFIGDRKTGEAVIRGGDTDWPTEYRVSIKRPCPAGLVLGEEEKHWIITCFMAMSHAAYDVVAADFEAGDFLALAVKIATVVSGGLATMPAQCWGKNGAARKHPRPEGLGV